MFSVVTSASKLQPRNIGEVVAIEYHGSRMAGVLTAYRITPTKAELCLGPQMVDALPQSEVTIYRGDR
jgi:hypothetical protein